MNPEEFAKEASGLRPYQRRLLKLMSYCQQIEKEDIKINELEQPADTDYNLFKQLILSYVATVETKLSTHCVQSNVAQQSSAIGLQNIFDRIVKVEESLKAIEDDCMDTVVKRLLTLFKHDKLFEWAAFEETNNVLRRLDKRINDLETEMDEIRDK